MSPQEWYYQDAGAEHGPFTLDEMLFLKNRRLLTASHQVRQGRQAEWQPASSFKPLGLTAPPPAATRRRQPTPYRELRTPAASDPWMDQPGELTPYQPPTSEPVYAVAYEDEYRRSYALVWWSLAAMLVVGGVVAGVMFRLDRLDAETRERENASQVAEDETADETDTDKAADTDAESVTEAADDDAPESAKLTEKNPENAASGVVASPSVSSPGKPTSPSSEQQTNSTVSPQPGRKPRLLKPGGTQLIGPAGK